MYSSGWSNRTLGPVGSAKLAFRAWETLDHLRKLGVRVSAGNRLEHAAQLTDDLNQDKLVVTPDNVDLQNRVLEAFRTIWESFLIVHTLLDRKKVDLFPPPSQLEALVRGAPAAKDDSNAKPRSTQLEMLIAARLVIGGADVRLEEPDLTFLYHGAYLGVAVKRVTKPRVETLETALRDGSKQLARNDRPGFVALSVDPWLSDLDVQDGASEFGRKFNEQIREAHRLLGRTPDSPFVLGCMIIGHDSGFSFDRAPPSLRWIEAAQFLRFSEEPDEVAKAVEFFGPLGERTWNGLETAIALLKP